MKYNVNKYTIIFVRYILILWIICLTLFINVYWYTFDTSENGEEEKKYACVSNIPFITYYLISLPQALI